MARSEIAEKLSAQVEKSLTSWLESDVVYFFVQIRKLLDHAREATQQDLPHLRFYCDWVVHISKDRIDPITLGVIKTIEADIVKQMTRPFINMGREAVNFAYFVSLKNELITFLKAEGIDCSKIEPEEAWINVIITLVKVLENQPLNIEERHGTNIKQLIFLPAAPRCVIMRIVFSKPVDSGKGHQYPYYELKNAY